MMNELTNYSIFNENTGEIIQYLTMEEIEYLKSNYTSAPKGNSKLNDRGEEFIPNNDLFKQFIKEELGGFYFNYYNTIITEAIERIYNLLFALLIRTKAKTIDSN